MILIRHNREKHRSVYFCETHYRKIWDNIDPGWITAHVADLNRIFPGYVLNNGHDWIDFKIVSGTPASQLPHTPDFVERIHSFCLSQIEETTPWYHGDWTLSNMIVDGDTITMIDWDNLGCYPKEEVYTKLNLDLKSAFGDLYVF